MSWRNSFTFILKRFAPPSQWKRDLLTTHALGTKRGDLVYQHVPIEVRKLRTSGKMQRKY